MDPSNTDHIKQLIDSLKNLNSKLRKFIDDYNKLNESTDTDIDSDTDDSDVCIYDSDNFSYMDNINLDIDLNDHIKPFELY